LAVGSISYLGAFPGEYRKLITNTFWIPIVKENGVICSDDFSLIARMGDPMKIQDWILHGLPLDDVS
jgi:dynein heavy chain